MAKAKKFIKKDRAIVIVNRELEKGKTRGQILTQLQTRLDMTKGGAENYYQRITSGVWQA